MESFIDIPEGSDFPLNNLPYGAFTRAGDSRPCLCVALGDQVVDLGQLQAAGCFTGPILGQQNVFTQVSAARSVCGIAAAVYQASAHT
jgi:fumarylacetoacetase